LLPVPVLVTGANFNGAAVGTLYLALGGAVTSRNVVRSYAEPIATTRA